jgi:rhodanese-related sulfurtransferase
MSTNQILILVAFTLLAFFVLRPILFGGPRVSATEAQARIKAGTAVLVDVREPGEWRDGVAVPASLLAASDYRGARKQWAGFLRDNKDKEIILYCASGMRSGMLAMSLKKDGYKVANLGGFGTWTGAGLPVRKPSI